MVRWLRWWRVGIILDLIPEKVRKIVGWILLIFGAVAILGFWLGGLLFWLTDYEGISTITSIVGIFSIVLGLIFLLNTRGPLA